MSLSPSQKSPSLTYEILPQGMSKTFLHSNCVCKCRNVHLQTCICTCGYHNKNNPTTTSNENQCKHLTIQGHSSRTCDQDNTYQNTEKDTIHSDYTLKNQAVKIYRFDEQTRDIINNMKLELQVPITAREIYRDKSSVNFRVMDKPLEETYEPMYPYCICNDNKNIYSIYRQSDGNKQKGQHEEVKQFLEKPNTEKEFNFDLGKRLKNNSNVLTNQNQSKHRFTKGVSERQSPKQENNSFEWTNNDNTSRQKIELKYENRCWNNRQDKPNCMRSVGSSSVFALSKDKNRIKRDWDYFNEELIQWKNKLRKGKNQIPKKPSTLTTENNNSFISNNKPLEESQNSLEGLVGNNDLHNNFTYCYNSSSPNELVKTPNSNQNKNTSNKTLSLSQYYYNIPRKNNTESFSFEILAQCSSYGKDRMIIELKRQVEDLTRQLNKKSATPKSGDNSFNRQNNESHSVITMREKDKDNWIRRQNEEISQLKRDLYKTKDHVRILVKKWTEIENEIRNKSKEQRECPREWTLDKTLNFEIIVNANAKHKLWTSSHTKNTITKATTTTTRTKQWISSASGSRLINKFNICTDLTDDPKLLNTKKTLNKDELLGGSLVFKISENAKFIICFDVINRRFHSLNYADYSNNFENSFNAEGSVFITYNSIFYLITGKNHDELYSFNFNGKTMSRWCKLSNNHQNAALIGYASKHWICVSGAHNKKVEIYSIAKNNWEDLPEMSTERAGSAVLVIKNRFVFAIFGFNALKKEYWNTIEFFDMESRDYLKSAGWEKWYYSNQDLISCYIKGMIGINYNDEKIILIGGWNGENGKSVERFIQVNWGDNFLSDTSVEVVDRKLKDVDKNKSYLFSCGFEEVVDEKGKKFNLAFDDDNRWHMFELQGMGHDVFYYCT